MKTVAKIIAYLVWFGFVLGLSVLFFLLVVWIENRAGIFSEKRFWIILVSWFGFVVLMAWLPVWLAKKKGFKTARLIAGVATFLIILLGCAMLSGIIWQMLFPEKIYNCTDDNIFGFLRPGDWVHGNYITVPKIDPSDSMSKPDSIKEGWSVGKLWFAWWAFIVASVGISATTTRSIFRRRKSNAGQAISL